MEVHREAETEDLQVNRRNWLEEAMMEETEMEGQIESESERRG